MRLDDEVIAHVAKLLQLSIITGTDIVDHMRMMRLQVDEETGTLCLNQEYVENSEANVQKMLDEIKDIQG